jgi:hypothetical protein
MTDPKVVQRLEALDVEITRLDVGPVLMNILLRIVKELVIIHSQIDHK